MRRDLVLCGEMFSLGVIRHRYFEVSGAAVPQPTHPRHRGRVRGWRHGQWHEGPYLPVNGNGGSRGTVADWQDAMGMPWVSDRRGIAEAIPLACTEHVGASLIANLGNGEMP